MTTDLADTSALRVFSAVAESGSFSEGARRLGMTRSAAGKAIARLEALLQVRLLNRTTRRVGLTPEGRAFHEKCTHILQDIEDAQNMVGRGSGRPRGTLRLTVTEAYGQQVILPVLGEFLALWPDLAVEASFTDRMVDIVEEGFDLAIRIGAISTSSQVISKVVARSVGRLYAAPGYLDRQGRPDSLEALAGHARLVFGTRERPYPWTLRDVDGVVRTAEGPVRLLSDNTTALQKAAVDAWGIVLLPDFLALGPVEEGTLEPVLPGLRSEDIPIHAIYPSRRYLSPKIRGVLDFLGDRLS